MSKNKLEVLIGGNIYTLQGSESKEHIHRVASLIDQHLSAIQHADIAKRLNMSQLNMLAALNLADDYLKLSDQFEQYEKELQKCSEENLQLLNRIEEIRLEMMRTQVNKHRK